MKCENRMPERDAIRVMENGNLLTNFLNENITDISISTKLWQTKQNCNVIVDDYMLRGCHSEFRQEVCLFFRRRHRR